MPRALVTARRGLERRELVLLLNEENAHFLRRWSYLIILREHAIAQNMEALKMEGDEILPSHAAAAAAAEAPAAVSAPVRCRASLSCSPGGLGCSKMTPQPRHSSPS